MCAVKIKTVLGVLIILILSSDYTIFLSSDYFTVLYLITCCLVVNCMDVVILMHFYNLTFVLFLFSFL